MSRNWWSSSCEVKDAQKHDFLADVSLFRGKSKKKRQKYFSYKDVKVEAKV